MLFLFYFLPFEPSVHTAHKHTVFQRSEPQIQRLHHPRRNSASHGDGTATGEEEEEEEENRKQKEKKGGGAAQSDNVGSHHFSLFPFLSLFSFFSFSSFLISFSLISLLPVAL